VSMSMSMSMSMSVSVSVSMSVYVFMSVSDSSRDKQMKRDPQTRHNHFLEHRSAVITNKFEMFGLHVRKNRNI